MGTPLSWPPFQWSRVLVPPQTCLNYQTRSSGTIQPSLPLRALWLLHTITHKNTRNLSTKSSKRGGPHAHARARAPTLAAADEHPEEAGDFQHHLAGWGGVRWGAVGRCSRLRNKKDVSRAPLLRRDAPPLATAALPRLLPAMPSWTRAPAPSAFTLVCAVDPDGGGEFPTKKTDGNTLMKGG